MKRICIFLLLICSIGCYNDHCSNFVTYEERIPLYTVDSDSNYVFINYIVYNDVMESCDCLLLANQESGKYLRFLEGLDVESDEFQFHSDYPTHHI